MKLKLGASREPSVPALEAIINTGFHNCFIGSRKVSCLLSMIEIGFVKGFGRIWKEFKLSKLICSMAYGDVASANSQTFLKRETLLNQPHEAPALPALLALLALPELR